MTGRTLALLVLLGACDGNVDGIVEPGPDGGPGPEPDPMCIDDRPSLPTSFARSCAGCHSAHGGGSADFPDLFEFTGEVEAFVDVVRTGRGTMPAIGEDEVSTADLEQMHAYFHSGLPEDGEHCGEVIPVPSDCGSEGSVSVRSLFAPSDVIAIRETRADGALVTRAAGRVRGRHELEGTFSEFGPHYFENRSYAFEIEDTVAMGGDTVHVTYEPIAPVSTLGPGTNFRYWKIYGDGNVFYRNTGFDAVGENVFRQTVEGNAREERPMRVGDVLEFEFGIFIAGQDDGDPGAIEGRTSYYSDTFRYVVGEGRLTAENADTSGAAGPSADARLAGDTTIPWIYAEPELYFSQMALNMQPEHVQRWLEGRRLFHTDFETGAHGEAGNPPLEAASGMLGPSFNTNRCSSCHEHNGYAPPPEPGATLDRMVVKLYGDSVLGSQLQPNEGATSIERYEESSVTLADGTVVMLERPRFSYPMADLRASVRLPRRLVGLGLLEAIDERDLLARADPMDCDGNGISGRAQLVADPRTGAIHLGRFGWKAEKIGIEHQVADALEADLGVTSSYFPEPSGGFELEDTDLARLTAYMRLLGLPAQRNAGDPRVAEGARVFAELGCASCHAPTARTGSTHPMVELRDQDIRPYSDLLVHDLGDGLADDSGGELSREWRTAPLWGIGLVSTVAGHTRFLHDGRARSILEAILWHGGEAEPVKQRVIALSTEEREALLAFLESL